MRTTTKRTVKRGFCLLLALVMVLGLVTPALANPVKPLPSDEFLAAGGVVPFGGVTFPEEIGVIFHHPALAQAIADYFGEALTFEVDDADLAAITSLDLSGLGIEYLEGMEYLTGLTSLDLSDNSPLEDLWPLEGLTGLTNLDLSNNAIEDISYLTDMVNLTTLRLEGNLIENIEPLEDLVGLTSLSLADNQIVDIGPLEDLVGLTWLSLANNQISDPTVLGGVTSLTELSLANNQIANPAFVTALTNLTTLSLADNLIADTTAATWPTSLTTLSLADNQINNLVPLDTLTNLTSLTLDNNLIADTNPLSGLTGLTELFLAGNLIADPTPLNGLTNLTDLSLTNNRLFTIAPIAGLLASPALTTVDLTNQTIELAEVSWLGYTVANPVRDAIGAPIVPAITNQGTATPSGAFGEMLTWTTLAFSPVTYQWTYALGGGIGTFSGTVIQPLGPTYTVTFDLDGGTADPAIPNQEIISGNFVTAPTTTPIQIGYEFDGWYTAPAGGGTPLATTAITGPTAFYANWTPAGPHDVTFDLDGGTATPTITSPVSVQHNAFATAPTGVTLTKIGYNFDGWVDNQGDPFAFATTRITAPTTIYAAWTAVAPHTVTFDLDGGTATPPIGPQTVQHNAFATAPTGVTLEKAGHDFDGWVDAQGNPFAFATTPITASITIYADWSAANMHTVTFALHGGDSDPAFNDQSVAHNDFATAPAIDPERSGYAFTGWFTTQAVAGVEFDFATMAIITNPTTIHARWTPVQVITFNPNSGSFPAPYLNVTMPTREIGRTSADTYGLAFDAQGNLLADPLDRPTRPGYIFQGWFPTAAGGSAIGTSAWVSSDHTRTLFAQWTIDPAQWVSVTFDPNGGNFPGGADLTRSILHGGTNAYGQAIATDDTLLNPVLGLPTAPLGYFFAGWYDTAAATGGNRVTNTTLVTATTAHTLYARWVADDGINQVVTFNPNNGTWPAPADSADNLTRQILRGTPHTYAQAFDGSNDLEVPSQDHPTRAGYNFLGWFDTAAATGGNQVLSGDTVTDAPARTFWARWERIPGEWQDVTFDPNGGTWPAPLGGTGTVTREILRRAGDFYGQTIDGSDNLANPAQLRPTRIGYTFEGWYDAQVGGTQVAHDTPVDQAEATVTLWARWARVPGQWQILTFNPNDGTWPAPAGGSGNLTRDILRITPSDTYAQAFDDDDNLVYTVQNRPTRAGYDFQGWYSAETGGTRVLYDMEVTAFDARTLYARWERDDTLWRTVEFDLQNGGLAANFPDQEVLLNGFATAPATNPTKTGYGFDGWFTTSDGNIVFNFATMAITDNTTIYAQWTRDDSQWQDITFHINAAGGEFYDAGTTTETRSVLRRDANDLYDQAFTAAGNLINEDMIPRNPGYAFQGWFTAASGGTEVLSTDVVTNVATRTLYAQWTFDPDQWQEVTFDPNSGVFVAPYLDVTMPTRDILRDGLYGQAIAANNEDLVNTPLLHPTKVGYEFWGWFDTDEPTGGNQILHTTPVSNAATRTLYARWVNDLTTQLVTFNPNGGAFAPSYGPLVERLALQGTTYGTLFDATGTLIAFPPHNPNVIAAPTWPGNTFLGWFDAPTGGNQILTNAGVTADEYRTFYAQWAHDPDQWQTVTFDPNGGVFAAPYLDVTMPYRDILRDGYYSQAFNAEGNLVNEDLNRPTREGHTFLGWFDSDDEAIATEVEPTIAVTDAATRTLYAHWAIAEWTVEFDLQGGDDDPAFDDQTVTHGEYAEEPDDPERENYEFRGWFTTSDGNVAFDFDAPITEDTTIYAQWTRIHQVIFDLQGGEDEADFPAQPVLDGQTATAPAEPPTKDGFEFAGWFTTEDGDVEFDFTAPITANTTVYAQWTRIHTVSFDLQGGEDEADFPDQPVLDGEFATAPAEPPTKDNHEFRGWFTTATGSEEFNFATMAITEDTTIFAQWTPEGYHTVSFNLQNGGPAADFPNQLVPDGETAEEPDDDPTRENYEFAGWFTTADGDTAFNFNTPITGDTVIFAQWTRLHTVTFNLQSGGEADDFPAQSVLHGETADAPDDNPTRTGYTFRGWFTTATGNDEFDFEAPITENTIVFAQWTPEGYHSVTFNLHGGSPAIANRTVADGETTARPANNPTREGYVFVDWFTAATGGTVFNFAAPITASTTIHAQWTEETVTTFTVTFNLQEGTATPAITPQEVEEGETATEPPNDPTRAGHIFQGWFTAATGGTEFDFETPITANITIFAQWTVAPRQTVTFNPNSGIFTGAAQSPTRSILRSGTYGQAFGEAGNLVDPALALPTRDGYRFVGWYDTQTGGTRILQTTAVSDAETRTLWARWEQDPAQRQIVTFNPNGGAFTGDVLQPTRNILRSGTYEQAFNVIGALANPHLVRPSREGHAFAGWFDSQENANGTTQTGRVLHTANVTNQAERTLWARWTPGPGDGSVSGTVTRPDGTPAPDAEVIIRDENGNVVGETTTGPNGSFTIPGLPPGNYEVIVIHPDHGEQRVPVVVGPGQNVTIPDNIQLREPRQRVIFHPNGGTFTGANQRPTRDILRSGTYAAAFGTGGGLINPTLAIPSRSGFIFGGWFDSQENANRPANIQTGRILPITNVTNDLDRTLWARWEADSGNGNNGGPDMDPFHMAYLVGFPDGTIRPRQNMTRAEVATIFFRLISDEFRTEYWSQTNTFTDVNRFQWYNNAVSTMTNVGLFTGMPGGRFEPNREITRGEFASVVMRLMDGTGMEYDGDDLFDDIAGHWATDAIHFMALLEWAHGDGDGGFRPNDPITRAEVARIVNRMLNRVVPHRNYILTEGVTEWPDNRNPNAWYFLYIKEASHSTDYARIAGRGEEYKRWLEVLPKLDFTLLERANSRPDDIELARDRWGQQVALQRQEAVEAVVS